MLSSIFLLNRDAVIIIEKQYREKIPRSEIDSACLAIRDRNHQPPAIIANGDLTILLYPQNDIWIVGVCDGDEFALLGVSVLKHVGQLLQNLLKDGCNEVSIKNDYPTCYQILDYAIDYGFPYVDESNAIQTLLSRPPSDPKSKGTHLQLDLDRPWRQVGIKRITNEILMDIVETVDVVVSPQGRADFCHIRGSIEVISHLSDMPLCKLILAPSSHYEDTTFHRCVETDAQAAKVIPFYPPDGQFTLMSYRLTAAQTTLPLWIIPKFAWVKGSVTFELTLKPELMLPKPLEEIEIRFELPMGVGTPSLSVADGRASYESNSREVVWTIQSYGKKDPTSLRGSASTEVGFDLAGRFPIVTAKFITVGSIPSNFKIDRLDVEGVDYKSFKGVKYITKAGSYEFRTGLC